MTGRGDLPPPVAVRRIQFFTFNHKMPHWLNLSLIMIDEFVLMSLSELAAVMNMQNRLDDVPRAWFYEHLCVQYRLQRLRRLQFRVLKRTLQIGCKWWMKRAVKKIDAKVDLLLFVTQHIVAGVEGFERLSSGFIRACLKINLIQCSHQTTAARQSLRVQAVGSDGGGGQFT